MRTQSVADVATVTELALQFAGFRNVDLCSQGIYQLRVSARGLTSGVKAVPVALLAGSAPSPHHSFLLPAHTLQATSECCSPAFRVRFCEEEVRATRTHARTARRPRINDYACLRRCHCAR